MKLLEMFNDNYTEMYRFWFLPPNQSVKFNQGHTEFAYEHPEEFGLNIDDVLEDIEDERDEYIRELVHDYKTVLKSKGEI